MMVSGDGLWLHYMIADLRVEDRALLSKHQEDVADQAVLSQVLKVQCSGD